MSLILFIFVVIVLIVLSGFFSGSETALTAVSRARMHQLEREGSSAAREVNRLVADKERMIGAILFGNTFLNILISSLTTEVLAVRFGQRAIAITVIAVTLVAMQVLARSGDLSRDVARAVSWALAAEPGSALPVVNTTAEGEQVRLQDLLRPDALLEITMHSDFAWWIFGDEPPTGEAAAALKQANDAIMPTEAVTGQGVEVAYWVDAGEKAHLRWVRQEPEEQLLAALARLAAREELDLGAGSRFAGSFRAHGVLVPVWDLDREQHAREWIAPAESFAKRLAQALDSLAATPLTDPERRALRALHSRQLTLR